jgi:hypothetical protein
VGGGGGKPRLLKRWTVEEEKKLSSAVETFGTTSWAKITANVPGRNESQCWEKWRRMSKKAASTVSGAWTTDEEKKLVSAVETLGTTSWARIAVNVQGRNETQCRDKWQNMSKKAAATASGAWTAAEEIKLASAVETFGTTGWAKVAAKVPGRNEKQCRQKWQYLSKKIAATVSGAWTVEEEKQMVSAVETFGATSWDKIAANVPGRSETQCSSKWQKMYKKAFSTVNGTWTVAEEIKLASAVATFGATSWAKVAANVPGRSEIQCCGKWRTMSKKAAATASGAWTAEEEMKLAYGVETYYGGNWAEIAKMFPGRNESQCRQQWLRVSDKTVNAEPPKKRRRFDWV